MVIEKKEDAEKIAESINRVMRFYGLKYTFSPWDTTDREDVEHGGYVIALDD